MLWANSVVIRFKSHFKETVKCTSTLGTMRFRMTYGASGLFGIFCAVDTRRWMVRIRVFSTAPNGSFPSMVPSCCYMKINIDSCRNFAFLLSVKNLLSDMLDPSKVGRLTIQKIMENKWIAVRLLIPSWLAQRITHTFDILRILPRPQELRWHRSYPNGKTTSQTGKISSQTLK